MPGKYVIRVCFESPFTRMISNLISNSNPGIMTWMLPGDVGQDITSDMCLMQTAVCVCE